MKKEKETKQFKRNDIEIEESAHLFIVTGRRDGFLYFNVYCKGTYTLEGLIQRKYFTLLKY